MKVTWGPLTHTTCVKYYYLKWFINDCNATEANISNINNHLDDSGEGGNGTTPLPDENSNTNIKNVDITTVTRPKYFYILISDTQCEWHANLTEAATNDYVIGGLEGCEDYGFQIYINNNETIKSEQTFVSPEQGMYVRAV